MSKGRREPAIKNLCWIRKLDEDDIYIKEELYAIDTDLERQMASGGLGFWQPFKLLASNRHIQWRFFLGGSLFFWQNGSGINAINYYSPTVFKSIGIAGLDTSLFTTGLFGVVKTVFTIIYLVFLIDQYGRRRLLMIGAAGGSLCLWYVGAYIAIAKPAEHPTKTLPPSGVSAVFFFYLWTAFYSPTWNPTPWVYNSEMFDQNVRTLAQAFAAMSNCKFLQPFNCNNRALAKWSLNRVLELYRQPLHTTNVHHHGLRGVLLLCLSYDRFSSLRVLLDARDKEHPIGGHRSSLRPPSQGIAGTQHCLAGIV